MNIGARQAVLSISVTHGLLGFSPARVSRVSPSDAIKKKLKVRGSSTGRNADESSTGNRQIGSS